MAYFVRVKDRSTGHEYDVAESGFDPDAHVKVNKPAQWPDLESETDRPRPPLHNTDKAGSPANPKKESA